MIESNIDGVISFTCIEGKIIFFPMVKTIKSSDLLRAFLCKDSLDNCNKIPEAIQKIADIGGLLSYNSRSGNYKVYPQKGSVLETKIREFEELN
jgi:hypothetical protein